jgi:peptide methionine sulfoxide reductase msrA/msrB
MILKLVGSGVLVVAMGLALMAARPGPPETPAIQIKANNQMKTNQGDGPLLSRSGHDISPLSSERIEELAADLTEDERRILLRKGTEPAFCGDLLDNKSEGTYLCRLCDLPLFESGHKFNSGTGWPSFFRPVDLDHVAYERDTAHGMERVEILCARCRGHLGHVFDDAPQTPTGLRYCLNSASLDFFEKGQPLPETARPIETSAAYFAGGCFWGVEDRFQRTPGVINAVSGYMGGAIENPTYKQVCEGDTGHAETVMVVYDPTRVTYAQLLEKFFKYHDPTQLNRQGPDIGSQYRSAIFTADAEQEREARAFIERQQQAPRFASRRIATQVEPVASAGRFYPAEAYHQDYHEKHGGHCPMPEEE